MVECGEMAATACQLLQTRLPAPSIARVTERWTPGCATRMRGYGAPNRRLADASLAPCNQPCSVPGAFGGGIHCLCPEAELESSFHLEKAHRVGLGAVNTEQEQEEAFGDGQEPNSEI